MPFVADGHYIAPGFMPLPGDTMGQRLCSLPPLGTAPVDYELPSVKEARMMQEHGEPWGPDMPIPDYPVYTAEDRARENGIVFDMAEEHSRELLECARNYAKDVPEPRARLISEQPGYENIFGTSPDGRNISVLNPPRENLAGVVGVHEKAVSPPDYQEKVNVQTSVPFFRRPKIDLPEKPKIDCNLTPWQKQMPDGTLLVGVKNEKEVTGESYHLHYCPDKILLTDESKGRKEGWHVRHPQRVHLGSKITVEPKVSPTPSMRSGSPPKKAPKKEFSIIGAIIEEVEFWGGILS